MPLTGAGSDEKRRFDSPTRHLPPSRTRAGAGSLKRQCLGRQSGIPNQSVSVGNDCGGAGCNNAERTSHQRRSRQDKRDGAGGLRRVVRVVLEKAVLQQPAVERPGSALNVDATPIVEKERIFNHDAGICESLEIDRVPQEVADGAVPNRRPSTSDNSNPVQTRARTRSHALDVEPLKENLVVRPNVDMIVVVTGSVRLKRNVSPGCQLFAVQLVAATGTGVRSKNPGCYPRD